MNNKRSKPNKRQFAVLVKSENNWFKTLTLTDLSRYFKKAMQFTIFPYESKHFYVAEILNGVYVDAHGVDKNAKMLDTAHTDTGVYAYNILTGETTQYPNVADAAKSTNKTVNSIIHRANVYSLSPWPTDNLCFKWEDNPTPFRTFTEEEKICFTDMDNIHCPVKYRSIHSHSAKYEICASVIKLAKLIDSSVGFVSNAMHSTKRVKDYEVRFLV